MPNWNQVLQEIADSKRVDGLDFIRRSYLEKLYAKRSRNIICYYSGWLQKPGLGGQSKPYDKRNKSNNFHKSP